MDQERREEGVELLRNALVAANLSEHEGEEESNREEMHVLNVLVEALLKISAIDEVEPLVVRYRELAKAKTATMGRLSYLEVESFRYSAQLQEVPCICTSSWQSVHTALPFHQDRSRLSQDPPRPIVDTRTP